MAQAPLPQLIAALEMVFGQWHFRSLGGNDVVEMRQISGRVFWLLGALWNGVQLLCGGPPFRQVS